MLSFAAVVLFWKCQPDYLAQNKVLIKRDSIWRKIYEALAVRMENWSLLMLAKINVLLACSQMLAKTIRYHYNSLRDCCVTKMATIFFKDIFISSLVYLIIGLPGYLRNCLCYPFFRLITFHCIRLVKFNIFSNTLRHKFWGWGKSRCWHPRSVYTFFLCLFKSVRNKLRPLGSL